MGRARGPARADGGPSPRATPVATAGARLPAARPGPGAGFLRATGFGGRKGRRRLESEGGPEIRVNLVVIMGLLPLHRQNFRDPEDFSVA
jgi:hypothetical protein